eukprot:g13071.t1
MSRPPLKFWRRNTQIWVWMWYSESIWSGLAAAKCQELECDCDQISSWVETQCNFHVGTVVTNEIERRGYCAETRGLFQRTACPAACWTTQADCTGELGKQCMATCGNWAECKCRNRRGTTFPVECTGTVENSMAPCEDDPPPGICGIHMQVASACSRFHFCPQDKCIIRNIACVAADLCQGTGVCIPSSGHCVFPNLAKGTPCDDGLFYTPSTTDKCNGYGTCVGVPDLCEMHNIKCMDADVSCAELPGQCNPDTGKCMYTFKPYNTPCDDGRIYTAGDKCTKGICSGIVVDLCGQITCEAAANDPCRADGECNPATGLCEYKNRKADRTPCGPHALCVEGLCVADNFRGNPKWLSVGEGQCADQLGKRMGALQLDVEDENECKELCRGDPSCVAYNYMYESPVCTLYSTIRTESSDSYVAFAAGDFPSALEINRVLMPLPGEVTSICRKKDWHGDGESGWGSAKEFMDFLTNFGMTVVSVALLTFYFWVSLVEAAKKACAWALQTCLQLRAWYRGEQGAPGADVNCAGTALFVECLNRIRETRTNIENHATQNLMRRAKDQIQKLTNDEIHLVRNMVGPGGDLEERPLNFTIISLAIGIAYLPPGSFIRKQFARLEAGSHTKELKTPSAQPETNARSLERQALAAHKIDPYWDPFFEVQSEKERVNQEFVDKLVSAADARQRRTEIRRAVRRAVTMRYGPRYDPLKYNAGEIPQDIPKPHRLHERFWTPDARQQRMNAEKDVTWRDVDILQHHIAPNGWILPRRTTMLSRRQQLRMATAVKTAREMALLPFDWRPQDFEAMPLMDPLQFTLDRLTQDVENPRSRAMLEVMLEKYPELNFEVYLDWKRKLVKESKRKS